MILISELSLCQTLYFNHIISIQLKTMLNLERLSPLKELSDECKPTIIMFSPIS